MTRSRNPDAPAYVYIVGWQAAGPIKIGYTTSIYARLAALQTSSPFALSVWMAIRSSAAASIERACHETIKHLAMRGEWFDCTAEDAMNCLRVTATGHDADWTLWRNSELASKKDARGTRREQASPDERESRGVSAVKMPKTAQICPHCWGQGQSGAGHHCYDCEGTGFVFEVGAARYANTREGRGKAAYARRVMLGREPRTRTEYAREYARTKRAKQREAEPPDAAPSDHETVMGIIQQS